MGENEPLIVALFIHISLTCILGYHVPSGGVSWYEEYPEAWCDSIRGNGRSLEPFMWDVILSQVLEETNGRCGDVMQKFLL